MNERQSSENGNGVVVGPAHCEDHRAHVVGCLNCAYEVAWADDLDLSDYLDAMEHIGWPT